MNSRDIWTEFYRSNLAIPLTESSFANEVVSKLDTFDLKAAMLVDIGCGNLRDSIYFSNIFSKVIAVDQAEIDQIPKTLSNLAWFNGNMCESGAWDYLGRQLDREKRTLFYGRFFLHSLPYPQQKFFLDKLIQTSKIGDFVCLEYRNLQDQNLSKINVKDNRWYVNHDEVVNSFSQQGFKLLLDESGQGYSKYLNEDPSLSRLIVERV